MIGHPTNFSRKDGQQIIQTLKKVVESYYQSPNLDLQKRLISLNRILVETVSSRDDLDCQQIITKLQLLKIKVRNNQILKASVLSTIEHLKSPKQFQIQPATIISCLEDEQLFEIGCIIMQRLARTKNIKKENIKKSDFNEVINKMCIFGKKNKHFQIVLVDTLLDIITFFGDLKKQSGIVDVAKHFLNRELIMDSKMKGNIRKYLKILLTSVKISQTLPQTHQQLLSKILLAQPSILLILQQTINISYSSEYCEKFLHALLESGLDQALLTKLFIWSHSSMFCTEVSHRHFQNVENFLENQNNANDNGVAEEVQFKVYCFINNVVAVNQYDIRYAYRMPNNVTERVMKAYLYLIIYVKSGHFVGKHQLIDIEAIQKICKEESVDTWIIKKLIIAIKQSSHNINHTSFAIKRTQSISTQPESVLESLYPKASKIPKNDEDIKNIHQILIYQLKSEDAFERDNLRSLKNRALQSLRVALLQNQNIYFQKIFNFLDLGLYDAQTLKKLLQIANFQLKLSPKSASVINVFHLAEIILKLDDIDHDLLNFQQLSEIFYICLGNQDWNLNKSQFKTQDDWKDFILEKLREIQKGGKMGVKITKLEDIVEMMGKISLDEQHKDEEHQMEIQDSKEHPEQHPENKQVQQSKQNKESQMIAQEKQQVPKKQIRESQSTPMTGSLKVSQMVKKFNEQAKMSSSKLQQDSNQDQKPKPQSKIQQSDPNPKTDPTSSTPSQPHTQSSNPSPTMPPLVPRPKNTLIPNIILRFKVKRMVQFWKKRVKKSKGRWYVLREWHETQCNYLKKLFILKNQLLIPLLQSEIINALEGEIILPNLQAMIKLSQEMKERTAELLQSWNPIKTELAPTLKPMINFIKIYKDYSENYQKSKKRIEQLQQDPKFKTFVKVDMKTVFFDYLPSPYQRFMKYFLLVREYHQKLPSTNKDKLPLQQQLQKLKKINHEINQFREQQQRSRAMLEIEKKFGNVVANARFFKAEFVCWCQDFKCKVYVFNDLVLAARVAENGKEELFVRIKLTGKSFLIRKPDCKAFANRLYICGVDTSIHVNFTSKEKVDEAEKLISECLSTLYQNQYKRMDLILQTQSRIKQGMSRMSRIQIPQTQILENPKYQRLLLSAQVVGMQKIFYHGILKSYFIVHFNISKPYQLYQTSFCQLSILQDLQKHLRQGYPKTRIPPLDIKCKETISNDLTKVSEHLCSVVEKFLNYILRNKYMTEKPERTLLKLGLHQSLWNLLNTDIVSQCQCQMCLHSEIFTSIDFYKKQIQLIQSRNYKFCILNSFHSQSTIKSMMTKQIFQHLNVDRRILWANCQLKRIDYRLQQNRKLGKSMPFKVHINILSQNVVLEIKNATIYSNSRQVIEEICMRLGIDCTLDLALVFAQDEQELILDDDQILYNFVKIVKEAEIQELKRAENANSARFSIFDRISWGEADDGKKVKKLSICLRKVLCLSYELEERQCEGNPERYNFIVGEILRKFQTGTLVLNAQDTEYLCATVYCIEFFGSLVVEKKAYVSDEKLKKYLPPSKWPLITNDFKTKISRIIQNQMSLIQKIGYLHKSLLKTFWKKYSFQTFILQNTEQSTVFGNYKHLQMSINYKKISISRKNLSAPLLEYSVQLMNYRYYADSLYLETDQKTHCFKGNNLYMLNRILQVYKILYEFQMGGLRDKL